MHEKKGNSEVFHLITRMMKMQLSEIGEGFGWNRSEVENQGFGVGRADLEINVY